ncbi:MAG: class I SAM-dependent methyltransferase [Acidimicrobiales bacterium]
MSRQNVYDDPVFFTAYQEMREAESGINAAVDQPALRALLPDVDGMSVLDLGCGDGRLCRGLAAMGAARIVGVDPSARMLALARERTGSPEVTYLEAFAEDVVFGEASFDLVVSSLALHYVADLGSLLVRVAGWLRPTGSLVATMEHPMRTADPERSLDPGVVDNYATEGRRDQSWFVDGVVKYHRRVSTILNAVIAAGFDLCAVEEPTPSPDALAARPDLDRHNRRPSILALAAVKTGAHQATEADAICCHGDDAEVLASLPSHTGPGADAARVDVVSAVAAIPYGRAPGSTAADLLVAGRGTCSAKHYLLARALREGWPQLEVTLWYRVYRLTPTQAASLFGPQASDVVAPEGLVDVHTYLQVDPGTGPLEVDATFPLDQAWNGGSSMPLRCTDGLDVAGGPSPAQTKQQLVRLHCGSSVREPFIAWLASR